MEHWCPECKEASENKGCCYVCGGKTWTRAELVARIQYLESVKKVWPCKGLPKTYEELYARFQFLTEMAPPAGPVNIQNPSSTKWHQCGQ